MHKPCQENDSMDTIWIANRDFDVQQYQKDDGDQTYIDVENVVDHGKKSIDDDLNNFIIDQDEKDETFVDYYSEDNENSENKICIQ